MAQSIGIHLGERRFHVVALEGGLKKYKVVCALSGDIPPGEGGVDEVAERLRELVREHKLRADSVYLACDSGLAAFRNLTLPFDERAKIEEVVKFEVESNLPQYDIEQVVVDFLVLSSKPGLEANLLVTAVPKERLARLLRVCERSGLEALEAELEGTALFDAAFEAGVLTEDAGTILIHVGDSSTTVAVADGRRLSSLRAIRAGAFSARAPQDPESERPAEVENEPASVTEEAAQRIRRELTRTLTAARTVTEIKQVYVCGHALPGLAGESVLGLPAQTLAIGPPETQRVPELVIALGAALRGFGGGVLRPQLRREELRFTGKFERLELPLAVFSLLLFTLLFVQFIVLDKQIEWRDEGDVAKGMPGDLQLWLEASNQRMLPDPKNVRNVLLQTPPEELAKYAALAQSGGDLQRTKFQEIQRLSQLLKIEVGKLSTELGEVSEIRLPQSALEATALVMSQMEALEEKDVRFGIRSYDAQYQRGQSGKGDYVQVTMDVDFFGPSTLAATQAYNQLENGFREHPWCLEFDGKTNKVLEGDKGIYVDRLTLRIDVEKSRPGGQS